MSPSTLHSPVALSYATALRGYTPRNPGESFTYADVGCSSPELLTCLAASNPEGRFFGLVENADIARKATEDAKLRSVSNVVFVIGTPAALASSNTLPPLNYLSYDESKTSFDAAKRGAVFDLAEKLLLPSGLLNITYATAPDAHGVLKFLVREFAPEMNSDQAKEFLVELKKLGKSYFALNPSLAASLDTAIAKGLPDEFFSTWNEGEALSYTFNTIVALRPRGFSYGGDAFIPSNYVELSVPTEAQAIIAECRDNPLYEAIKDFALNRSLRSDIWCREPAHKTDNMSALFGGFAYGITMPRDKVPSEFKAQSKVIDLSSPLYTKLINLMTLMPISIGDFLSHADGKDFAPLDIIGALQILIACGITDPMRGGQHSGRLGSLDSPHLAGSFNQYLEKTEISGKILHLASPVTGNTVAMTPREALVIQAVDRGGLVNSVAALLPELQRISKNPADAARIMDAADPTQEIAENMIKDVLGRSIIQWYAYGILEAA